MLLIPQSLFSQKYTIQFGIKRFLYAIGNVTATIPTQESSNKVTHRKVVKKFLGETPTVIFNSAENIEKISIWAQGTLTNGVGFRKTTTIEKPSTNMTVKLIHNSQDKSLDFDITQET